MAFRFMFSEPERHGSTGDSTFGRPGRSVRSIDDETQKWLDSGGRASTEPTRRHGFLSLGKRR